MGVFVVANRRCFIGKLFLMSEEMVWRACFEEICSSCGKVNEVVPSTVPFCDRLDKGTRVGYRLRWGALVCWVC